MVQNAHLEVAMLDAAPFPLPPLVVPVYGPALGAYGAVDRIAVLIDRVGEVVTVRRLAAGEEASVQIRAHIYRLSSATEIADGYMMRPRIIKISALRLTQAGFPGAPRPRDQILRGDDQLHTVAAVWRQMIGDRVAAYQIEVAGDA